jgi:hypothetical protein
MTLQAANGGDAATNDAPNVEQSAVPDIADPAPMLPRHVVRQIKRIGKLVREHKVAPLIGAGISIQCGLPSWDELVERLIITTRRMDPLQSAHALSDDRYLALVQQTFETPLETASYLRRCSAMPNKPHAFGAVVYRALYGGPGGRGPLLTPEPNHIHRHLVSMFSSGARRLWTTNYDDLLEESARQIGRSVRTVDPVRRQPSTEMTVAHLHGFLAPHDRARGHPRPGDSPVILAEDDFHEIADSVIGWTNREFNRIFDEYSVLILGMSLTDPNVRRVLARQVQHRSRGPQPHFAVMSEIQAHHLARRKSGKHSEVADPTAANELRAEYWRQHGVEIVNLPHRNCLTSFITRLRYESYGNEAGDLFRRGSALGYQQARPWHADRQRAVGLQLDGVVAALREEFGFTDQSELLEVGVFLLRPDGETLELTFRGGRGVRAREGGRVFSVDPDRPTGLAGRVMVSGDLVRARRDDPLHDFGMPATERAPSVPYEGIVSVPLIDWENDGVPLGVVYVTTSHPDGRLLNLPVTPPEGTSEKTVEDLYVWLADTAMDIVHLFR